MHSANLLVFSLIPFAYISIIFAYTPNDITDRHRSVAEYMIARGYYFEEHKVLTPDGYILTLWRIPRPINSKNEKRQPALLVHGLLDNGFTWIFKHKDHNFAEVLVDAGYDVWIGNNRGTTVSHEHIDRINHDWTHSNSEFWDFSIDEIAKYDMPSMVDYILEITNSEKIVYAGHSLGSVQFLVQSAINPDFINQKIKAFIGMAPVFHIYHTTGTFLRLLNFSRIPDILYWLGMRNFWVAPSMTQLNSLAGVYAPSVVVFAYQFLNGFTKNQTLDHERLPVITMHEPGGTSTQSVLHWMQMMRKDGLRMFDRGEEGNLKKYGQKTPPEYEASNLAKLKIPILLVVSKKDPLVADEDLARLRRVLPYHKIKYVEDYGHGDFVWSDDAHVKVYIDAMQFLKENNADIDN